MRLRLALWLQVGDVRGELGELDPLVRVRLTVMITVRAGHVRSELGELNAAGAVDVEAAELAWVTMRVRLRVRVRVRVRVRGRRRG